jgi:hypothetical protein
MEELTEIEKQNYKFELIDEITKTTDYFKINYVVPYDVLCRYHYDFYGLKAYSNQESNFSDYNKSGKDNVLVIFDLSDYNQLSLLDEIKKCIKNDLFTKKYKDLLRNTDIVYCDNYETFDTVMVGTGVFEKYVKNTYGDYNNFVKKYNNIVPSFIFHTKNPDDIIIEMEDTFKVLRKENFLDVLDELTYEIKRCKGKNN